LQAPGQVLSDLAVAVAVADGADAVSGIAVLTDRQEVFGQVASMPSTCQRRGRRRGRRRGPPGRVRIWARSCGSTVGWPHSLSFER
jgi:hypothetical protein